MRQFQSDASKSKGLQCQAKGATKELQAEDKQGEIYILEAHCMQEGRLVHHLGRHPQPRAGLMVGAQITLGIWLSFCCTSGSGAYTPPCPAFLFPRTSVRCLLITPLALCPVRTGRKGHLDKHQSSSFDPGRRRQPESLVLPC